MSVAQKFLARLGMQHPIIQAPMAGTATPQLVAAVSNAGGMGSLGLGASNVMQARQLIEQTQALTSRAFNVNFFCHAPPQRDARREAAWLSYLTPLFAELDAAPPTTLNEIYHSFLEDDEMFALVLALRPPVVSFHFGLPSAQRIQALKEAGIYTLATATNLEEARAIEQAGVDAIVAQGIEAGGHRGMFNPEGDDQRWSTALLLRLLSAQTKLPLIAAGGIMDGQGIRAMLDLGASAAQLGTAFILCPESAADSGYRANLKSEKAARTRLTPVLSGRPARGLVNRFIEFCEGPGSPVPAAYPVAYDATKHLNAAAAPCGRYEFAAHWAGQGAPLAREMPAAQLIATLVAEMGA